MENKRGRKSNYHSKVEPYFDEIKAWRQNGQTEENIAKLLGVSYKSLNDYKLNFPQFTQLLKDSKEKLIANLENTMFELALGKCKKTKNVYTRDPRTGKMILDKSEEETIAPNPTMLIFSLKNLASDRWQDRREMKVTTNELVDKAMDNFKLVSDELNKNLTEDDIDD